MPKGDNSTMYKLIIAFVMLIVGVVLIGTVATNTEAIVSKTSVANEVHSLGHLPGETGCYVTTGSVNVSSPACNVTITNVPLTGWKVDDCPINSVTVTNGSATWTSGTDYLYVPATGVIAVLNTTATNRTNNFGNNTYASYYYCGDDYLNSNFGRTSSTLVPGFFALALLIGALGLFYSVARDTGLINL